MELELPCRPWTGAYTGKQKLRGFTSKGPPGAQRRTYIYRSEYERIVGPIPEGYVIDHVCQNPNCWEPTHLEAVTSGENTRRHYHNQPTCRRGHAWTEENTIHRTDGRRRCRACYEQWEAEHRGN